jgi:geranylgeranyl diphosphate synthase type II
MNDLHEISNDFENGLKKALDQQLQQKFFDGSTPSNLDASIRYSLLAPGKRIRPRLTLACARMLGLSIEAALPPAYAIEMIHCFTLIHDDLPCMDNDDFRRGKPSNHKVHGESIALLAGDALIPVAINVYLEAQQHVSPESLLRGLKRLNWAMGPCGVIGGQAAEALMNKDSKLAELRQMHAQKTGALFSASILIPMDLAGISSESAKGRALETFASELGLGFQVADDLDDATETHAPTSILHFLSEEEARQTTHQSLETATRGLTMQWGEAATPLVRIAEEVLRNLYPQNL